MSWIVALRLAGCVVLSIGAAHLVMPTWGYDSEVVGALAPEVKAHFHDLGTYAIGVFLIAFGALSLAFSRRPSAEGALFCAVMVAVWSIRLLLELLFPVELALFRVPAPHAPLLGVVGTLCVLYALAAVRLAPHLATKTLN
ncbi:MAG: hypothetical protein KTR31_28970 [Myxococcales bacterium]|nr:hypothetical protein [Myxococcales bacterium]